MKMKPILVTAMLLCVELLFACGKQPASTITKTLSSNSAPQHKVVYVDWQSQVAELKKKLVRDPNSAFLHNQIAVAYNALGDFSNSDREIHTAMKLSPDDSIDCYTAFAFYQQRHLRDKEMSVLDKALEIDPGNAFGHYEKAGLLEDDKKWTDALTEYQATKRLVDWVKANPDNFRNSAWMYTDRRRNFYDVTWEISHIDDDLRRVNTEMREPPPKRDSPTP
jgi:tetratricopeptide (TPR) repeat protein